MRRRANLCIMHFRLNNVTPARKSAGKMILESCTSNSSRIIAVYQGLALFDCRGTTAHPWPTGACGSSTESYLLQQSLSTTFFFVSSGNFLLVGTTLWRNQCAVSRLFLGAPASPGQVHERAERALQGPEASQTRGVVDQRPLQRSNRPHRGACCHARYWWCCKIMTCQGQRGKNNPPPPHAWANSVERRTV